MIFKYFTLGGYHIMNDEDEEIKLDEETNHVNYYSTWYNELLFISKYYTCDWKDYVFNIYNLIETVGIKCSRLNDTALTQQ